MNMRTFLVINTSFFGDILLTDPLCRNIKAEYPDAKLIFIVNKPFYEVARYMDGVDEVLCYDKKGENKGIQGFLKFYHAYKKYLGKIDAAFVIYGNERGILLAKMFGSKKIYSDNHGILKLLLTQGKTSIKEKIQAQDKHSALLEAYTDKAAIPLPMLYTPPQETQRSVDALFAKKNIMPADDLIVVCTTTKRLDKDMDKNQCVKLIAGLKQRGKKVLLVGSGQVGTAYVEDLKALGCTDFINLVNQTTIAQLAAVIKRCKIAVSVDTGTMHLICALRIPVVAVFYLNSPAHLGSWAPKDFYPHRLMAGPDFSAGKMLNYIQELEKEGL